MKQTIDGVFLLLEDDDHEIMIITENNEKNRPRKRHGQFSVPAGTVEKGENEEETIERELGEEVWPDGTSAIVKGTLEKIGELFLETDEFKLHGRVYKAKIAMNAQDKVRWFYSEEVERVQVVDPYFIFEQEIENIRPGLLEVLLLGKWISSDTIYIEDWSYRNKELAQASITQLKQLYNNETPCYW